MTNHHRESLTTYPKPGPTEEQELVDEEMMSLQMQALRITNSLAFPMVFKAALELGVLDTIVAVDDGVWLLTSEIAFSLPTKPTNPEAQMLLDRMLRLLVSHSILKCRIVEPRENDRTGNTQRVLGCFGGKRAILGYKHTFGDAVSFRSVRRLASDGRLPTVRAF